MKIEILETAQRDLGEGFRFHEQGVGLGWYFLDNLCADIESLSSLDSRATE